MSEEEKTETVEVGASKDKKIISESLKQRLITAFILIFCLGVFCYLAIYFMWARVILLIVALLCSILSTYEFIVFTAKSPADNLNPFSKQTVYAIGLSFPIIATFFSYILPVIVNVDNNYILNLSTYTQGTLITSLSLLVALWGLVFYALDQSREENSKFTLYLQELFPSFLLLSIGGSFLVSIAALPFAPVFIIWLIAIISASDIGAYFVGKAIGKTKIVPSISPNKTVLGSLGGLLTALIVGFLLSPIFYLSIPLPVFKICVFSVVLALLSQLGDILQSYLKRLSQVKDSGNMLPGHGGMFDRIDGLLAAAPLFFLFIVFLLYT